MIETFAWILSVVALPLSSAELNGTWRGSLQIAGPDG